MIIDVSKGCTSARVYLSFTETGVLMAEVQWPEAASLQDRHITAYFNGKRWVKTTGEVINKDCGYDKLLRQVSKQILKAKMVIGVE